MASVGRPRLALARGEEGSERTEPLLATGQHVLRRKGGPPETIS